MSPLRYLALFTSLILCACATPIARLVNGEDAARNAHPYIASIKLVLSTITVHNCGGTILSPTWLLTAANCEASLPGADFTVKVVAGILDVNEAGVERVVVDFVVHPKFEGGIGPYDLALLKVGEPLPFSESIQSIALPIAGIIPIGQAVVTGWGSTTNTILQQATVTILTQNECADALVSVLGAGAEVLLDETNVCTGPEISACSGDSGSPLVQEGVVVGLVSWGITPCGYPGAPSVYTRVSSHIDFILQYVDDLTDMTA